jgi:hypothetical protein
MDEGKRVKQVEQLLPLVNKVVEQNGGRPYTNELFAEWKVIVSVISLNFVILLGNYGDISA